MKTPLQILCFIFLLSLTSCTSVFYKIYGIKEAKIISPTKLETTAVKQFKISPNKLILLDSGYKNFCKNHYLPDTSSYNLALQPLQLRIYKNDTLIAFQANCNVGGFPNLNWQRASYFSALPSSYLALKNAPLLSNDYPVLSSIKSENNEYVVVVFYTNFMHRQSKRLIQFAKSLEQLHPDKKFSFNYINAEELFY